MKASARVDGTRSWRVALVVIARDEAARLPRLLNSLRPWVDDMLVLDTGSRDETAAVAAKAGARVEHLAWPDDFSQARNAALDLACADWHVILDADEWLESGGDILQSLRHRTPDFVGSVRLMDRVEHGGLAFSHLSRIFPGHLRYRGRIHEQVAHTLPVRPLGITIGHDGYLPDRMASKRGRNRVLLEAEVQAHPADAYLWYQLGKDCDVYDEHAAAERAFARAAAIPGANRGAWWSDLVVRRLTTLKALDRHAEALDLAQAQEDRCGHVPDFFFALADVLLDASASHPEHAAQAIPLMEEAWRRCLTIGERADLPATVPGRGSWMAASNLAMLLEGTGRSQEARQLRERHARPSLLENRAA